MQNLIMSAIVSCFVIPVLKAPTVGEGGYPEVFGFKKYWIPDKNLGNDE